MKNQRKILQSLTLILQFGINMIVPILLCSMGGIWLGRKYEKPVLVIPFFIIGALAGFNSIYRMARKMIRQDDGGEGNDVKKIK